MVSEVKWDDRFNIGVEVVDRAHRRLFAIVNKLLAMNTDTEKNRHACKEGIKFFKNYAVKHFSEEEAYMKSINYKGYFMGDHTPGSGKRSGDIQLFSGICQTFSECMCWLAGGTYYDRRPGHYGKDTEPLELF